MRHSNTSPNCRRPTEKWLWPDFAGAAVRRIRFVTNNQKIKAAFAFYGATPLTAESVERIKCPVYGFYASNDAHINATLSDTADLMKKADKKFEPVTYEGAGHGFMRARRGPRRQSGEQSRTRRGLEAMESLLKEI